MNGIRHARKLRPVTVSLVALAAAAVMLVYAQGPMQAIGTSPDREQKLAEAAKKEGSLTLYTSLAQKDIAPLVKPFEDKYGIKVKVWRSSSENVLQRIVSENTAKRYDVDAIQTTSVQLESLHREKQLQPVDSPLQKDLISGAVPAHHEWAATYLAVWVQAYNTNTVKKEDLPKSYRDLLDPKWNGKLGIEGAIPDWYATVAVDMGEDKGIAFFRELVKKNGISVRNGHSLLNNLVAAGEVPLALTVYHYMPESAKQKGAPIDWFVLDPAVAQASGVAVAVRPQHPYAAQLFYDYMLSTDAQSVLAKMNYVSTNTKVPSPLRSLRTKVVDPVLALDQADKWQKSFEDVIVKQGRR
jgi:iron(III) transport system substrate-binding protein